MRLEANTKCEGCLDIGCAGLSHLKQVLAGIKLTALQLTSKFLESSEEVAKQRSGVGHLDKGDPSRDGKLLRQGNLAILTNGLLINLISMWAKVLGDRTYLGGI